jgi:hypothetical protein
MKTLAVAVILTLLLSFAGCSKSASPITASSLDQINSTLSRDMITHNAGTAQLARLTPAVADGLQFMREEEKVARDVYRVLDAKWNLREMANIAQSEQRHMDAIKILLARYGVVDPAKNTAEGAFVNQSLQQLYGSLSERGLQSVTDAYQVGKLIEETDIADLDKHLAELTTELDIKKVYSNLRQGSLQHLAAFSRHLR